MNLGYRVFNLKYEIHHITIQTPMYYLTGNYVTLYIVCLANFTFANFRIFNTLINLVLYVHTLHALMYQNRFRI